MGCAYCLNPYDAKRLGYRLYATLHKLPREVGYSFCLFFEVVKLSPRHMWKPLQYIPQQGQSLHIWTISLSTTGCYKNKYAIKFFWVACISRFATAILSGETELALVTIRVKSHIKHWYPYGFKSPEYKSVFTFSASCQVFL